MEHSRRIINFFRSRFGRAVNNYKIIYLNVTSTTIINILRKFANTSVDERDFRTLFHHLARNRCMVSNKHNSNLKIDIISMCIRSHNGKWLIYNQSSLLFQYQIRTIVSICLFVWPMVTRRRSWIPSLYHIYRLVIIWRPFPWFGDISGAKIRIWNKASRVSLDELKILRMKLL